MKNRSLRRHKRGIPGYSAVVYTGGTFDLPHAGHLELLEYCRAFAGKHGKVIVALNKDEFIKRFKGHAPIMSFDQRKKILSTFKWVDEVVENIGNEDSKITIGKVKPDIVLIGMDWVERDYCKQMQFNTDWLNENKISLIYVPRTTGVSTTLLKDNIRKYK